MAHAIFYMQQTSGMFVGMCMCNWAHQMEKTDAVASIDRVPNRY